MISVWFLGDLESLMVVFAKHDVDFVVEDSQECPTLKMLT